MGQNRPKQHKGNNVNQSILQFSEFFIFFFFLNEGFLKKSKSLDAINKFCVPFMHLKPKNGSMQTLTQKEGKRRTATIKHGNDNNVN